MIIERSIVKKLYEIAQANEDYEAIEHLRSMDPLLSDPGETKCPGIIVTYAEERAFRLLKLRTRKRDSFAIIGSIDKEKKEQKHKELLGLISEKTDTYFSMEGIYVGLLFYHLITGHDVDRSFLACDLSKEAALEIGRRIGQAFIVWKDSTFFGILRCEDGSVERVFNADLAALSPDSDDAKALAAVLLGNYAPQITFAPDGCFFQLSPLEMKSIVK